ncbi:CHAT domain-containing protein [Pseudorhodoplanes sp.]|uniref:CHAT domain-containing protein n=1 Tax=Pseudorhodoplanes sp. TaxID=1934341 RepID=UPI002B9F1C59|nr:CHAT domain-containing protein [Pseudorhodoplanes sp.]HWV52718.1 CHAT domain-containing protein [Pseudorhodoplanes sp.]
MTQFALDDLYRMLGHIYADKNMSRTSMATFSHFVEVCGMLTIHDRKKKREGLDVTDALCKALGWYFPLLAKMRVNSVEELVFRKFPNVCPYCRSSPHREAECKLVKGTNPTVSHEEVSRHFKANWDTRPRGLNEWQQMFQRIYPRSLEEHGRSTIGLLEELGELAEAIRVFEIHPRYFLGEAADTFSYLMGIANEHQIKLAQDSLEFSFEKEFLARYPGLCGQCGSKVCVCPGVPQATVGRMAKELEIGANERPFFETIEEFSKEGKRVAHEVLESFGGHAGLSTKLPFDRGDANRAIVELCLRISGAVESTRPDLAEALRVEAVKASTNAQEIGTRKKPFDVEGLLTELKLAWADLDSAFKADIKKTEGLVGNLGEMLDTIHVLFVSCNPVDVDALRVNGELRILRECAAQNRSVKLDVDHLPAATVTDFRRGLLDKDYDLVHFAGHSDGHNLIFEKEGGEAAEVPLDAIRDAINRRKSIKGVVLNACETARNLDAPISPATVGMEEAVDDDAALEFTRGFYDALVRGMSVKQAYEEGITAVKLANYASDHIRLIER